MLGVQESTATSFIKTLTLVLFFVANVLARQLTKTKAARNFAC